jgi:hypothetical protein
MEFRQGLIIIMIRSFPLILFILDVDEIFIRQSEEYTSVDYDQTATLWYRDRFIDV